METVEAPWYLSCGDVEVVTGYAVPGRKVRCGTHGMVTLTRPVTSRPRPSGRKAAACGGSLMRLVRLVNRARR